MRYAANISMLYAHLELAERPAAAAADGFGGVEILFPYGIDTGALTRALRLASLPVVLINTPPGDGHERGLAAVPGAEERFRLLFELALHTAGRLECAQIHTMAGLVDAGRSSEALATLIANLRWAARRANDVGVGLTLEGLNQLDVPGYLYATARQVTEVLDELHEPNVGLQFDLYHTAKEGLSARAEIEAVRPWIRHVQIAGPPHRHEPAAHDAELFAALAWLDSTGYDGWVGFEYRPRADTTTGLSWCTNLPAGPRPGMIRPSSARPTPTASDR